MSLSGISPFTKPLLTVVLTHLVVQSYSLQAFVFICDIFAELSGTNTVFYY